VAKQHARTSPPTHSPTHPALRHRSVFWGRGRAAAALPATADKRRCPKKRGAHQAPENAPACIRSREGVGY
jgi:hypothetical protein